MSKTSKNDVKENADVIRRRKESRKPSHADLQSTSRAEKLWFQLLKFIMHFQKRLSLDKVGIEQTKVDIMVRKITNDLYLTCLEGIKMT
eukprot:UN14502